MHNENSANAMTILTQMFEAEIEFMRSDGKNFAGIRKIFHPDVTIHEPMSLPYRGDWNGHGSIARLFQAMSETWSEMNVENMNATMDDRTIYMHCTLIVVARKSLVEVRQPFAEVLMLKDGLVIEGTPFYHDTEALNHAIGLSRPHCPQPSW